MAEIDKSEWGNMGRILSILGVSIALFVIILIADNARLRKKEVGS